MKPLLWIGVALVLSACTAVAVPSAGNAAPGGANAQTTPGRQGYAGLTLSSTSPKREDKVVKTEADWKQLLTPESFDVLRHQGTERAGTGSLLNVHDAGTWSCGACGLPLFTTETKFESGTGWPSFYKPVKQESVWIKHDTSIGMDRYEVLCARCDGHLGHVFDDGPADKTGLRYCMNSVALTFKKST